MEQRTSKQNRALHSYLEHLADALDREGHTLQDVVACIRKAEIRPTKENMKEVVWKPMMKALYGLESTTELSTAQVDRVYEAVNAFVGREFHIHVSFPSINDVHYEHPSERP